MKAMLHTCVSILLIFSIGMLGVSPEAFHHHDHPETCNEQHEAEVDACHLAIHHGEPHACEDHDHLLEDHGDCAACDLALQNHWLFSYSKSNATAKALPAITLSCATNHGALDGTSLVHRLRGPPCGTFQS